MNNAWFLSSLAAVAEREEVINNICKMTGGRWNVRVFESGRRKEVEVDDYLPCWVNGGAVFGSNRGGNFWVSFIEKGKLSVVIFSCLVPIFSNSSDFVSFCKIKRKLL